MPYDQRSHARATLTATHVPIGTNFHTLNTTQVYDLMVQADIMKYRAPKNANGSRARYFHDMLQRRAARKEA